MMTTRDNLCEVCIEDRGEAAAWFRDVCANCGGPACAEHDECSGCGRILCRTCDTTGGPAVPARPEDLCLPHPHNN